MLRLRADLIGQVHTPLPDYCCLPQGYVLNVTTGDQPCDHCDNRKLRRQRTVKRYPVGILLGQPVLRHVIAIMLMTSLLKLGFNAFSVTAKTTKFKKTSKTAMV
jgi:hypothetical protein